MFFITGNQNKYQEALRAVPSLRQMDIDLTEIQDTSIRRIIDHKLEEGAKQIRGSFFVEDVSMAIDSLNGFPGPLIKWMIKHMGAKGIHRVAGGSRATVTCSIGLYENTKKHFFEGTVKGTLHEPRGKNGFGFDPIFMPDGADKTFGEMTITEKRQFSHREKALQKLAAHVAKQGPLVMVFCTFDVLHPGHLYFFREAKRKGARLLVVLARDKTIRTIKGKEPCHPEKERLVQVSKVPLVDKAVLGNLKDQYAAIRRHRPAVIALGHDQESFVDGLQEFIEKEGLNTRIVRLSPYKRHKYRSSLLKAASQEHKSK